MQFGKDIGFALGILGGTTLGSGISFLMSLEPSMLMLVVGAGGLIGAAIGVSASIWINSKGAPYTE
ncbi:hypothetical protein [Paenibacillus pini]|uniref:Uncharacterized protein n=1 Tax=Paenibacillus pini JCM 16418 TaxID=1236976 RepID=W7Y6D1_9BACL|nr:hypothetical protein [Paenibacillus pini]GAF06445.1 hypothetical protein JCM16418_400 [Paenibacillus pini JCM 16418]